MRNPETTGSIDPVTGEWKKKEKRDAYAQKKQRRQVIEQAKPQRHEDDDSDVAVVERRATTGYAPEPSRNSYPLGIFNLLFGSGGN